MTIESTILDQCGIRAQFGGKAEGNMSHNFGDERSVWAHRANLFTRHSVSAKSVATIDLSDPSHPQIMVDLEQRAPGKIVHQSIPCDGMLTRTSGQSFLLTPADCIPLILGMRDRSLLGLVHISRACAEAELHRTAAQHIVDTYGVAPKDIFAYLGPSISQESYDFDFLDERLLHKRWQPHTAKRGGKYYLDMQGYVVESLLALGIPEHHIAVSPVDTYVSDEHFSHRRSKATGEQNGRNGCIVTLKA